MSKRDVLWFVLVISFVAGILWSQGKDQERCRVAGFKTVAMSDFSRLFCANPIEVKR